MVGLFGWRLGSTLSPDALRMVIGMLFGMLAGVPFCLMLMASRQQADQLYQQQSQQQRPQMPAAQYQPPTPNVIFIAPHVRLQNRGEQIENELRRARFYMQCINVSTDGQGRAVYDFTAQIGTKVSIVSRFVENDLSQLLDSDFRATRAGSMIQIFEYRPQNATVEIDGRPQIEREQLPAWEG